MKTFEKISRSFAVASIALAASVASFGAVKAQDCPFADDSAIFYYSRTTVRSPRFGKPKNSGNFSAKRPTKSTRNSGKNSPKRRTIAVSRAKNSIILAICWRASSARLRTLRT